MKNSSCRYCPYALPAELLDDHPEQKEARVVVPPLVARLEVERFGGKEGEHRVGREVESHEPLPLGPHARVAPDPRRVVEQVAHRDPVPLRRIVGEELLQRVVERELSLLHQPHDRCRGELLGDRADAVDRLGRRRHVVLEVGEAVSLGEDGAAVLHDRDRDAGGAMLGDCGGGDRVDVADEGALVLREGGRAGHRASEEHRGEEESHARGEWGTGWWDADSAACTNACGRPRISRGGLQCVRCTEGEETRAPFMLALSTRFLGAERQVPCLSCLAASRQIWR